MQTCDTGHENVSLLQMYHHCLIVNCHIVNMILLLFLAVHISVAFKLRNKALIILIYHFD